MEKWILIMLTWPAGVAILYSVIVEGIKQDPFSLAVHEMLFVLVGVAFMVISSTYSKPIMSSRWAGLRHSLGFFILATISAILTFLFIVMPLSYFSIFDNTLIPEIGVVLLVCAVFYGVLCLYRRASIE